MIKSFFWTSILALVLMAVSCREHECPTVKREVVLRGASLPDAACNSVAPSLARGSDERIYVSAWTYEGDFGITRTFINFDLSSIPAGSTILKAELTLYADTSQLTTPVDVGHAGPDNGWYIKRITSDWLENSTSWSNKPTYDNVGEVSMDSSTSKSQTYVANITHFVQDQLDHPGLYYGVMLQLKTEVRYRLIAFCSREHRYAAKLAPQLKIVYVTK